MLFPAFDSIPLPYSVFYPMPCLLDFSHYPPRLCCLTYFHLNDWKFVVIGPSTLGHHIFFGLSFLPLSSFFILHSFVLFLPPSSPNFSFLLFISCWVMLAPTSRKWCRSFWGLYLTHYLLLSPTPSSPTTVYAQSSLTKLISSHLMRSRLIWSDLISPVLFSELQALVETGLNTA